MTDIAAEGPLVRDINVASAARRLLVLMFLGLVSFALISDQPQRNEQEKCGPFTLGLSALGGCDRLQ